MLANLKSKLSLGYVFAALLVLDLVLQLTPAGKATGLLSLAVIVIGMVLGFRAIRYALRQTIWRLRNRLYVTYIFIGVVPVVLVALLALAATYMLVGQVAVYLVSSELERSAQLLSNPVEVISQSDPEQLEDTVNQIAPVVQSRVSKFEVLVRGKKTFRFPADSTLEDHPGLDNYTGFVRSNKQIYLWCSRTTPKGTRIVLAAPLTMRLLERLVPAVGTVMLTDTEGQSDSKGFAKTKKSGPVAMKVQGEDVEFRPHPIGKLPEPYNPLDLQVTWFNPLSVKPESGVAGLIVDTRPSAVLSAVFGVHFDTEQIAFLIFIVIASMLLMTEIFSLVIGISLTRTITGAVHELYEGTQKVAKGDFSYRIPVKGKDQLAELNTSFNNMSAQIEQLVVIAKEKERMESELAIAREVQNQLFPRSAPVMKAVRLTGVCHPARSVSGDYYDYLKLPEGNLAFAIGDVAGKGISAALLMASIQSIMRTQLASGDGHSTCKVVAQLNKQLYANTSAEKYATFFFGIFDESGRKLTYTNAGHLPPLLLHAGEVTPLEVTGTVVGAFPMLTYGEQTVELLPGDLLVSYTDGITEPENAYGEEFGEQRLAETILKHQDLEAKEIAEKIIEAVMQWSNAPELPDDMTIVIAQGLA